jgi:translocation and assembly module TamB
MADELTESAPPAPPRPRARWISAIAKAVLGLLIFLVAAVVGFGLLLDTDLGHRLILDRVAALAPESGLRIRIGRIEGSIWGETELRDVRLYDQDGLFAEAPAIELDWRPFAWFANRLIVNSLTSELAIVHRAPHLIDTPSRSLPGYDIHVGRLAIAQLRFEPEVTGRRRSARLSGEIEYRSGRFLLDLEAAMRGGGDRIDLLVDAAPDRDRLDLRLRLDAPADGMLARMIGAGERLQAELSGAGSWTRWDGSARIAIAGRPGGELHLAARSGRYGASGWLAPAALLAGRLAELAAPRINLSADGRLDAGVLSGTLAARSAAMRLALRGGADLRRDRYQDVRAAFELLRPFRIGSAAQASGGRLLALLDGPFAESTLAYRLTLPRLDFGPAAIEQLQASGSGRWSGGRLTAPLALRAARLSGSDGPLLADIAASGTLVLAGDRLSAQRMSFASERLRGQFGLDADLASGRYAIAGRAATAGFPIEGVGLADLEADFRFASSRGPPELTGRAQGILRRIDDAALAWASGGPIRFESGIAASAAGLRFPRLTLASPALSLSGDGERRADGTIRFAGTGRQRTLGALALTVEGSAARPRLALAMARPLPALGLRDVRVDLDPAPGGVGWRARGGSPVGAFSANGSAALGGGGPSRLIVAALSVSGARASGVLRPAGGGLSGQLDFRGALSGPLILTSAAGGQRIETHLVATDARLGRVPLGSGRFDAALEIGRAGSLAGDLRFAGAADRLWGLSGVEAVRLSGPVALQARLGGTLQAPSVSGSIGLEDGRLLSSSGGVLVHDLDASGSFDGSRLVLASLAGRTDGGGRIGGSGTIGFSGATDLRLEARGALLGPSPGLSARVSGPLRIVSDGRGGTISGELSISEARLRLAAGSGAAGGGAPALPSGWRLALRLTGEDLAVEGGGLESEWRAELRVGGTLAAPAVHGTATLVRGRYRLLGRSFDLTQGTATFAGETPIDPVLDILARTGGAGSLPIRITGRASRPQFGFASPLSSSERSPPPLALRQGEAATPTPRRARGELALRQDPSRSG